MAVAVNARKDFKEGTVSISVISYSPSESSKALHLANLANDDNRAVCFK